MIKVRIVVLLVGAIALILVLLALQLLAPGETLNQTGIGGAHVVFSVDHGMALAPGTCVTVRWRVDHIQAVHFNDQSTVGQGIRQVCPNDQTLPVLQVEFQDNTSQDYTLEVNFLVEQPEAWLLLSVALVLGLLSVYAVLRRPASAAPPISVRPTPRKVLIFAGVGLVASTVVVMALLLEVGLRFYFGQFGSQGEQSAYLRSRAEIDALASPTMPLPFVEYGLSPDFPGQNSLGYRGDAVQVPKPPDDYRIVALGDSTTYGAFVAYDQTYPYDLQKILQERYGAQKVEVVNGGVPGYNTWNMVADLAFRIAALQPDLVIVYAGSGDVGVRGVSTACYSGESPFLGLDPDRQLRTVPNKLSPSALYRLLAIHFGWMDNPAQVENSLITVGADCSGQTAAQIAANTKANAPVYFERNMREMIGIAKANGSRIMFMTSAYELSNPQIPDLWAAGVVEHNAITTHLAHENDTLFLDYAAIAPTDKRLWNDLLHLNPEGNLGQAQAIANYLIDQGVMTGQ